METEEVRQETAVLKYRSVYKSLSESLSLLFKQFPTLFRFLWPLALAYIAFALVTVFALRCFAIDIAVGKAWSALCYVALARLVAWLSGVLLLSGVVWQLRKLIDQGCLANVRLWGVWRVVFRTFWRLLRVIVVLAVALGVVLVALMTLVMLLLVLLHIGGGVEVSVGQVLIVAVACVVAIFLYVVALGVACLIFFEYTLGDVSMKEAFLSVGWGSRYLGRTIVVGFLASLLSSVLCVLMSLPAIVCSHIDGIALAVRMGGDPTQLPSGYPYLLLLSWILSAAGQCLCFLLISFPMCFNWGAIRTIESERQAKE